MLRIALAMLLVMHGVAHLPGVVGAWRLAPLAEIPVHTTVVAGRFDVGERGMRLLGIGWLVAAVLFWIVAAGVVGRDAWWVPTAAATAVLSLVLSVLELPYARIGVVVNLLLLALLVVRSAGWLSAAP